MTLAQILANLEYYGLIGKNAEACAEAYMERQEDGTAPDLAEFAEAWAAL